MRKELEDQTQIAQRKISEALQSFHDATGLIPTAIDFDMVDVRTNEDLGSGKRAVVVGTCELRASL